MLPVATTLRFQVVYNYEGWNEKLEAYRAMLMLRGATGTTPAHKLLILDGDTAIIRRVLRMLV